MHPFIEPVAVRLALIANAEKALFMKAYLKNKFEFLGIPTPQRRKVCKDYMKEDKLKDEKELETVVKELWMMPEREYQYFAIELLAYNKKLWQLPVINLLEYCIKNKSLVGYCRFHCK